MPEFCCHICGVAHSSIFHSKTAIAGETETRESDVKQALALQLDLALGELRLIDEALARRPALDDLGPKQRYEKIMRMCQFAAIGHKKVQQEPELSGEAEAQPSPDLRSIASEIQMGCMGDDLSLASEFRLIHEVLERHFGEKS